MLIGASMASNPLSDNARSRVEIVATENDEEIHGSAIITFLHSGKMLKIILHSYKGGSTLDSNICFVLSHIRVIHFAILISTLVV